MNRLRAGFLGMLLFPVMALADHFSAQVIAVMDGDTVLVLHEHAKLKIRLANIDAPEKAQPYGKQSRQSLIELVSKKTIQVDSQAVDQYGRTVAVLHVDGRNVNEEQVRRGMAWEYSHYHADRTYVSLQSEAQQARRGLWQQTSPEAPWQWRKQHPSANVQRHQDRQPAHKPDMRLYDVTCGHKKHCSQMVSCDEAHFYLNRCGVKGLDPNNDGIPCESLCR